VIRIGDEQTIALSVSQDFPRESQRQIANLRPLEHEFQRSFVQLAALAKLRDRVSDSLIERGVTTFAFRRPIM